MAETYRSPKNAWLEVKVEGALELAADLRRLPLDLRKKVYRPALRSAGLFVSSEVRKTLPKRTGELRKRKSVPVQVRIRHKYHAANIGLTKKSWYGYYIEYGARQMKNTETGQLRRFLDERSDEIAERFYEAVRKFIDKQAWSRRRHHGLVRGAEGAQPSVPSPLEVFDIDFDEIFRQQVMTADRRR